MIYWAVLSVAIVIIPLLMLFMGLLRWLAPVKRINYYFGYRSRRSTRSGAVWRYAQSFSGKVWTWVGTVLLVPALVECFLMVDKSMIYMAEAAILCLLGQVLVLLIASLTIEIALRRKFNWKGEKRLKKDQYPPEE